MSYCVSIVVIDPTGDPQVKGTPLFDRGPLSEAEKTIWGRTPRGEDVPMFAPGRQRPIGTLVIEEALQHEVFACYIPGIHLYYPGDWTGNGYFLWANTGKLLPATAWVGAGEIIYDSEKLVDPDWGNENVMGHWGHLSVHEPYREAFAVFLISAMAASRIRSVFVVCEYNNNATREYDPKVQLSGPMSVAEFWGANDEGRILIPSLSRVSINQDQYEIML